MGHLSERKHIAEILDKQGREEKSEAQQLSNEAGPQRRARRRRVTRVVSPED